MNLMNKEVMELVVFQIADGIREEEFLMLSERFRHILESEIPGFLEYRRFRDSKLNMWVEQVRWESIEAALTAAQLVKQYSEFIDYCKVLSEKMPLLHLEQA